METEKLLKYLCSLPGAGTHIEDTKNSLSSLMAEYGSVKTDNMGNVICTFGTGKGFVLDAHYDEVGLIVTSITEEGFLKIASVGGVDPKILQGREVTVHGRQDLPGVISIIPVHLKKKDEKVPEIKEMAVDLAMPKRDVEALVAPGDTITFRRAFVNLCGTEVSANCLDNRAGVATLILAAEKLKGTAAKITVIFSNQEELGKRGSKIKNINSPSDEAIVVDTSFGYTPHCEREECGEIAGGPMVGISPVLSRAASKDIVNVAKKNNIPYQLEIMNGETGTNADEISNMGTGVRCSLISVPIKYMHTPFEVVDLKDIEETAALIAAYVKERAEGDD